MSQLDNLQSEKSVLAGSYAAIPFVQSCAVTKD